MRIAYVCADAAVSARGSKGGSTEVRALSAALAARGHDVTLACRRLDGDNPLPPPVRVELMPAEEQGHRPWLGDLLSRRGADVVLERCSLSSGPALRAARDQGVPLVLDVETTLVDSAIRHRGLQDAERRRLWERELLTECDSLVASSGAVAAHLRACGVGEERLVTIPRGIDPGRFAPRGRAGRPWDGLPVVGYCGSLRPWHGVADLVEAVAGLGRPARLLVVGDGPERQAVGRLAGALGLEGRMAVTGAVPHAAVPAYLAAMDVAAAPYRCVEGCCASPLKVVEYLAAGLPVVASDQREVARLSPAVETVPPGRPDALAAAIRRVLDDGREGGAAARARGRALEGRSWAEVARRLEGILARAVGPSWPAARHRSPAPNPAPG